MAERPIDIITDDQDKLWYELDNNPESRKGPFDDFVALGHDLEKVLRVQMECKECPMKPETVELWICPLIKRTTCSQAPICKPMEKRLLKESSQNG